MIATRASSETQAADGPRHRRRLHARVRARARGGRLRPGADRLLLGRRRRLRRRGRRVRPHRAPRRPARPPAGVHLAHGRGAQARHPRPVLGRPARGARDLGRQRHRSATRRRLLRPRHALPPHRRVPRGAARDLDRGRPRSTTAASSTASRAPPRRCGPRRSRTCRSTSADRPTRRSPSRPGTPTSTRSGASRSTPARAHIERVREAAAAQRPVAELQPLAAGDPGRERGRRLGARALAARAGTCARRTGASRPMQARRAWARSACSRPPPRATCTTSACSRRSPRRPARAATRRRSSEPPSRSPTRSCATSTSACPTILLRGFDPLEDARAYGDIIRLVRAEVARRDEPAAIDR